MLIMTGVLSKSERQFLKQECEDLLHQLNTKDLKPHRLWNVLQRVEAIRLVILNDEGNRRARAASAKVKLRRFALEQAERQWHREQETKGRDDRWYATWQRQYDVEQKVIP